MQDQAVHPLCSSFVSEFFEVLWLPEVNHADPQRTQRKKELLERTFRGCTKATVCRHCAQVVDTMQVL